MTSFTDSSFLLNHDKNESIIVLLSVSDSGGFSNAETHRELSESMSFYLN